MNKESHLDKISTSVSVSSLTLKYLKSMKGIFEYLTPYDFTLNRTVLAMCIQTDYFILKKITIAKNIGSIEDFARKKLEGFNLSDEKIDELLDICILIEPIIKKKMEK